MSNPNLMKKIYALLVGINQYPNGPLQKCVSDAKLMESYCLSLNDFFKEGIEIQTLLDEQATKEAVVKQLQKIISCLTDEDTFLFYFSGHGAQEQSNDRFIDEQDQKIENLVCYFNSNQTSGFLLADKELRYLFSKCTSNPSITVVFDCCHSGDMLRSTKQVKRVQESFPARPYSEFLFHKELSEDNLKKGLFNQYFPYKNLVHLAACQPHQLAWEDSNGGVFTRHLLKVLTQHTHQVSCQFIAQWVTVNIRGNTAEKQTPKVEVQGIGKMNLSSNWLQLYPASINPTLKAIYKAGTGWLITHGRLMGLREGMKISVNTNDDHTIIGEIGQVQLEEAALLLPESKRLLLHAERTYPAKLLSSYLPLKLHICNLDCHDKVEEKLRDLLNLQNDIQLVGLEESDFLVGIFNGFTYLALSAKPYQPINRQLSNAIAVDKWEQYLLDDLAKLRRWHHFQSLHNPAQLCTSSLIKVELINKEGKSTDITDTQIILDANTDRFHNKWWYTTYQIKITNFAQQGLYILPLSLGSDGSISASPFDNRGIFLSVGASKYFYDHLANPIASCFLDVYKEVYNWEYEWFHYKFIVHTEEDISTSIPNMIQDSFLPPLLHSDNREANKRTSFLPEDVQWSVYTSSILMKNPSFNIISGALQQHLDYYLSDDRLRPFMEHNYTNESLPVLNQIIQ